MMAFDCICTQNTSAIGNEFKALGIEWVGYELATHLIAGYCQECGGGGILMSTDNEIRAYRIRQIYKNHGYCNVHVVVNSPENITAVSHKIIDKFLSTDSTSA